MQLYPLILVNQLKEGKEKKKENNKTAILREESFGIGQYGSTSDVLDSWGWQG